MANPDLSKFINRLKDEPLASSLAAMSNSRKALDALDDAASVSAEMIENEIMKISAELYAFIFRQAKLTKTGTINESLSDAIVKLGFERVKRLIFFYVAYSGEVRKNSTSLDRQFAAQLWALNYSVASSAEYWAGFKSVELANEAFYLGMLQNIGISAFSQLEGSRHRALRESRRKVSLARKETSLFGFNHYDLGCAIVNEWNLPPIHTSALRYEESHGQKTPEITDESFEDLMLFIYYGKYKLERQKPRKGSGNANPGFDPYFEYDKTILQIAMEKVAEYRDARNQEILNYNPLTK